MCLLYTVCRCCAYDSPVFPTFAPCCITASMAKLNISIEDFRAIAKAPIDVESITVLAGSNASGKSTNSRALFYRGYYANHYEDLLHPRIDDTLVAATFFLSFTSISISDLELYDRTLEMPPLTYDERGLLEVLALTQEK